MNHVIRLCVLTVLFFQLASCTKRNPVVCCTDPNDCASIGLNTENERTCDGDLRCIENVCTEVSICLNDSDCGGGTPICDLTGLCVECTSDQNCSIEAPRCSEEQTCVQCLSSEDCSGESPVCEPTTQTCRGCQVDQECASDVCDAVIGACIDESAVVYAAPAGLANAECSRLDPCSITSAIALTSATRETVKLNPGTYTANVIVRDKKVTIHGEGAVLTSATDDTLKAENRARLRVIGLKIANTAPSGSTAFECLTQIDRPVVALENVEITSEAIAVTAGCSLSISKSHIQVGTGDVAIVAGDDAEVQVSGTLIDGAQGNGIEAFQGSAVHVVNSVIVGQSGNSGAFLGVGGAVFVSYSTIIDSVIECTVGLISCNPANADGICVDNSIIVNTVANAPSNTVTGTKCQFDYTLVRPQTTNLGGVGNMLGVDPQLVDVVNNDFRLQVSSPAIDAADPASANVTTDFDGTPRPQGSANDLGAFEHH